MERPKRKNPRLKDFDYSTPGAYFITICAKNMKHYLGAITVGRGLAPAENNLSVYGKIADEQMKLLETRFQCIKIDKYVIMPNHIHAIISFDAAGASPRPTISDVICAFKSITTVKCKKSGFEGKQLFQTSFHDHIIRGERDYCKIWEYIDTNVIRWQNDCFYSE